MTSSRESPADPRTHGERPDRHPAVTGRDTRTGSSIGPVLSLLTCPHCGAPLAAEGAGIGCSNGHRFDPARQGYLNLARRALNGDSADMVSARVDFLGTGCYDPLRSALTDAVATDPIATDPMALPAVVDIGVGTGYYLSGLLDAAPAAVGLGVDASKAAARRAARAHPRAGVIVADAWDHLPIADGSATVLTSVFSPRNPAEFRRIIVDDGLLVVVIPTDRHLAELVERLALLQVDREKSRRLSDGMTGYFRPIDSMPVEYTVDLDHAAIRALVRMGPSARHVTPDRLGEAVAALPEPFAVTVSTAITRWRPVAAG